MVETLSLSYKRREFITNLQRITENTEPKVQVNLSTLWCIVRWNCSLCLHHFTRISMICKTIICQTVAWEMTTFSDVICNVYSCHKENPNTDFHNKKPDALVLMECLALNTCLLMKWEISILWKNAGSKLYFTVRRSPSIF